MKYNPAKHHRRSVRLNGYDYSRAGLYFITLCTQNRACLFGKVENGKMILNENNGGGRPENNYGIDNKKYKVTSDNVIDWFKAMTTNEYLRGVKTNNWKTFDKKIWQGHFHEHIIRNEQSRIKNSQYIKNNHANWGNDALN